MRISLLRRSAGTHSREAVRPILLTRRRSPRRQPLALLLVSRRVQGFYSFDDAAQTTRAAREW